MTIAFLHTAEQHVATFDRELKALGYVGEVIHEVRADLLATARRSGLTSVEQETTARLAALAQRADCVVCTCSTLGPVVDAMVDAMVDALPPLRPPMSAQILRIDRPMMQAALSHGPNILLALCLDSTRSASLELLQSCAEVSALPCTPQLCLCADAWPALERGDMAAFAQSSADQIRRQITANGRPDSIVLAQASMQVAEPLLTDLNLPVLASPALAAQAAVERTRAADPRACATSARGPSATQAPAARSKGPL